MGKTWSVDKFSTIKKLKILIIDGGINYQNLTRCSYGGFQNQGCALI